jgi:hypothetical protein
LGSSRTPATFAAFPMPLFLHNNEGGGLHRRVNNIQLQTVLCCREGQCWFVGRLLLGSSRTATTLAAFPTPLCPHNSERGGLFFQRVNIQLQRALCCREGQWRVVGRPLPRPSVLAATREEGRPSGGNFLYEDGGITTRDMTVHLRRLPKQS